MKINQQNTALSLLDEMTPFSFTISEDAEHSPIEYKRALGLGLVQQWPQIKHLFTKKIRFITAPFHEAYQRNVHRLTGVIDSEPMDESGTFISRAGDETNTIFYWISTEGKGAEMKLNGVIFFFNNSNKSGKPSLCICVQRNGKGHKHFISETGEKNGVTPMSVMTDIFSLLLFLKYCDLETKEVKAGKKDNHAGNKYINDTKQNIEILDSTWFTTIVRSEGFKVGGHFRMQPYGEGRAQKKLIWISDFEKHGYTKRAKAESINL